MLQSDFETVYDESVYELVFIDFGSSTPEQLHEHWDPFGPGFPVLAGCGMLFSDFSNSYIPYNILIDPDGVLLYSQQGFQESVLHDVIRQNLPAPEAVDDLSVSLSGGGWMLLDWTPVEGATDYLIRSSMSPFGPFDEYEELVLAPPASLPVLGEQRFYQVHARLDFGEEE